MSGPGPDDVRDEVPEGATGGAPLHRRPAVLAGSVVAVLVVAGVAWGLAARGGDASAGAPPGTTTSPSATAATSPAAPAPTDAGPPAEPAATGPAGAPAPDAPSTEGTAADAPPTTYVPVTEPAVALDAPAAFATGVTARLTAVESVQGEARGPGEVAGPAVRVAVELTNATGAPVGLDATVVNVYAGAELVPGEPLSGPGVSPLTGTLAPGATTTARYVFAVRPELRGRLQVTVSYDPAVTTVLFEGVGPPA